MDSSEIIKYFKNPQALNNETLKKLQILNDEFPYCSCLYMLLAKNHFNINSTTKNAFLTKAAVYVYNREKLYKFIHNIKDENLIQHNPPNYSIELSEFNNKDADDNFDVLKKINNNNDILIEKFLKNKQKIIKLKPEEKIDEEAFLSDNDDEFLSETLADIYWKQGRIDNAIKCFEKLSLKFPEKSSYFAAQIEKLKKII